MNGRFFQRATRETHDRDAVANFSQMRGCAVEFDKSAPRFSVNCIGLESLAIAQVANENFFVGNQANEFSQIGGNRKAAIVIQARARDGGAMNLRFEKGELHGQSISGKGCVNLLRDNPGLFQGRVSAIFVDRLETARSHADTHKFL